MTMSRVERTAGASGSPWPHIWSFPEGAGVSGNSRGKVVISGDTKEVERERGRHAVVFPPSYPSVFCPCLTLANILGRQRTGAWSLRNVVPFEAEKVREKGDMSLKLPRWLLRTQLMRSDPNRPHSVELQANPDRSKFPTRTSVTVGSGPAHPPL